MRTYLDHNATSPMGARVREALSAAFERHSGNASSPHAEGQSARLALEEARGAVAAFAGVAPKEVIFTSGGSESNNAAIRGAVAAARGAGAPAHVVSSAVEHPSVIETCRSLRGEGVEWSILRVDPRGVADPDDLARLLAEKPACLVSVMHAGNETGVIQPVQALARVAHEADAAFHTDIVQSAGKVPIREATACSDFAVLTSHKLGGPAGIGALIVREGARFVPTLTGGAQEGRRRAGTEPVPLAVAFAEAAAIGEEERAAAGERLEALRDFIEEAIGAMEPRASFHGRGARRLPNTTNVFIPGAAGRTLVMQLDLMGYALSTGSACSTGSSRPSHVLEAMGCGAQEALDSLRISLGPGTTKEEVLGFLSALSRAMEPAVTEPVLRMMEGAPR